MENFDLVVIGGGPGGYPAAIRAAQLGAKVALVEKEQLGGTCLNWGCIPTKTLIASSDLFARMQHADKLGLKAGKVDFSYPDMAKRKNEVVSKLRGGVAALLKANGVRVFNGTASFTARNRIAVKGATETAIEAKSFIIATGSVSAVPKFIPQHKRIVESRAFLDMTSLPASLIVLGGGVIGCEFACMAAQLGVKVTVVEMLEDILMILDADVRRELRNAMEKSGIRVLTGKPMQDIKADAKQVTGKFGEESLSADMLLVAVGRRPWTEGLGLDKAGLSVNKAGFIEADEYCRTAVSNIYAIGDVTGKAQLAHAATAQGITAAENACRPKKAKAESLVPSCIFTAPEVGSVGLTEQQAKDRGMAIKTGRYAFAALGKAMAMGETGGFVKWIAKADTDQLVGAHAVGPHATELISEAAVAIRLELTAEELGRTIHCHPTLSETWMEAAHALHGTCIHAPPKRKA